MLKIFTSLIVTSNENVFSKLEHVITAILEPNLGNPKEETNHE